MPAQTLSHLGANRGPRIVWCSDTHLGHGQPTRRETRANDRGPDFFANFARVTGYAVESGASALIHTGDFFFRSKVHPAIVDRAYAMVLDAAQHLTVIIVPGNHERSVLPPSLFFSDPNLHILDSPRTITLSLEGLRVAFSGFPFVREVGRRFGGLMTDAGYGKVDADARYLLLHQSIEGATVGPAGYRFRGNDPEVIPLRTIPAGLKGVLCGHVHRHQRLAAASPVWFCGSTERTSFAEAEETKGFCELWPETGDGRFIPLPTRPMCTYARDDGPFEAWCESRSERAIIRVNVDVVPYARARAALQPGQVLATVWRSQRRAGRRVPTQA